jgi:Concanavalin A-like lectin/glucanases superfamily
LSGSRAAACRFSTLAALALSALAILTTFAALTPTAALATQNPIAAYSFDEASGSVVHDLYGGHDGELEHAEWDAPPEWSPGRFGSALRFQGQGYQCVNVPQSPDLELREAFTIETWVRPEGSGVEEPLIFKEAPTFHSHMAYMLYLGLEANGKVGGYVEEEGWEKREVTSSKLPTGKWTHLALSFDGEALRLYVNGNLVDTTTAEGPQENEGPLKLGCAEVYGQDFEGKLDEVRIYDRAISGEEVQHDMETALQTPAPSQQPVAEYSFDAGEGTTVEDLSGNGRPASVEGAEWTKGKYGDALRFDGEEDCVSLALSPGLRLEEELTLEAWVRPEGELSADPIVFDEGEELPAYALGIGIPHSGKAEGVIGDGTGTSRSYSAEALEDDVWTHLAMTFDGAHLRLYVNGALVGTEAVADPAFASPGPITIGCDALYGAHFRGKIDELRIYNRALSGSEVQADMATPIETPQAGPIAAYSFDEGEGTTVEDLTGNGHTASVEGAEWTSHGKYGGAIQFNASKEDVLKIPASPELNLNEEFTLEAWVRPESADEDAPLITKQTTGSKAEPYYLYEGGWEPNTPYGGTEPEPGVGDLANASEPLPQKTWSHVALTYDGAKVRLYVNGELVDQSSAGPPPLTEGEIEIGGATEQGEYFDGRIDELRVYGRALDGGEIGTDKSAPIQTPQAGPVAEYSFDEGEGETAEDVTGNGHTATIEGATWTAHGRYGGAMQLNASEHDYLKVPDSPELDFTEEFTLEAWVRPEAKDEWAPIAAKEVGNEEGHGSVAYDLYEGWEEGNDPAGGLESEPGNERAALAPEALPEDAWSHVALTYDGAKLRLYVNGEKVAEEAAPDGPMLTEGELDIGALVEHGDYFDGRIDELRIYNRALSGPEVASDMAAPIQTPQQGPVAAYSFDEGEGSTAEDLTGNSHTATLEGATWARGKYGDAVKFDASEEQTVTIANAEDLNFSEEFTIEAWVKPEELREWATIFIKEDSEKTKYAYLTYGQTPEEEIEVFFKGEGKGKLESEAGAMPTGTWTHVAITDDGAHNRLYVNGVLVDTATAVPMEATDGPLRLGGNKLFGEYFDGRIEELRIYNRALSGPEVQADMAAPIQTPQQGPVATYSFDEGEGTTVEDLTGDGHTATIEGAEWTSHGKYGGAMEFNASEHAYLKVPDSPELDFTEEFTLEAWVRPDAKDEWAPILAKEVGGEEGNSSFAYDLYEGWEAGNHPAGGLESEPGKEKTAIAPEALPENVWSQLDLTYDGAKLRLYVNGEEVAEESALEGPMTTEGELEIGALTEHGDYYDGRIDELRVYDRTLSASEVSERPETELAPCDPAKLDPRAAASAKRETLGIDGHAVVYSMSNGGRLVLPEPPSDFEPLKASDEELALYGLPERPTDFEALEEWEEQFANYHPHELGTKSLCQSGIEVENPTTLRIAEEEEEGQAYYPLENWSGYAVVDPKGRDRFRKVKGIYRAAETGSSCSDDELVQWVGLGGFDEHRGLIQAGTAVPESGETFAWFEYLRKGFHGSISIAKVTPLNGHVAAGDLIYDEVTYVPSVHEAVFWINDATTGYGQPVIETDFNGRVYYNGATAEWIDERPRIGNHLSNLKDFEPVLWRGARVAEGNGTEVELGALPHKAIKMKEKAEVLARPDALKPNGRSFEDKWRGCGHSG